MLRGLIKNKKGVTLLELTVAVAIFSVIILSTTQIFKMVLDGQRNAIAAQNIQESMRYAFEVVSKEIRMAQKGSGGECNGLNNNIYLTENGVAMGNELYFKNYIGECVKYYLDLGRIKIDRGINSGYITPDEISVTSLVFFVVDSVGINQSKVTMVMDVEAAGKEMHKQTMKIHNS